MDFVNENYVWFIVGGLAILMAVIGYIADITDFGRKKVQKKAKLVVEDNSEKEVKVEKVKKEKNKKVKKEKTVKKPTVAVNDKKNNNVEQNINEPWDIEQPISSEVSKKEVKEDIPFTQNVENNDSETIDQSLFEPLPGADSVPVEENNESTVSSDDDIWKF